MEKNFFFKANLYMPNVRNLVLMPDVASIRSVYN